MIIYERTDFYGSGYLLRLAGSLIFRSLPMCCAGSLVAFITAFGLFDAVFFGDRPRNMRDSRFLDELFEDEFALRLFGTVFGFMGIGRMGIAYSRFWKGVADVKTMHAKWSDACSQVCRLQLPCCRAPAVPWPNLPVASHILLTAHDASSSAAQIITFDRLNDRRLDFSDDEFCLHMVRLFAQMSALVTMRLHVDEHELRKEESVRGP